MENPLVSIVILNWNGDGLIQECLGSLSHLEYHPVEIIIVDNGSVDASLQWLRTQRGILLLENKENLGFAKGNNIGFIRARGKYIAVLNNDVIVEPSWLNDPIRNLENDERIGIISCRQMNYYKREIIDVLYHIVAKDLSFLPFGRGQPYDALPEAKKTGFVLSASGGSAIYRKRMIENLGGFDERLFAYCEDADLSMRAYIEGWKCLYVPTAVVYHKGSASFSQVPEKVSFFGKRNRYLIMYKYFSLHRILNRLPWILNEERKDFLRSLRNKNSRKFYFSIWREVFKRIPLFYSTRRENIQKLRRRNF